MESRARGRWTARMFKAMAVIWEMLVGGKMGMRLADVASLGLEADFVREKGFSEQVGRSLAQLGLLGLHTDDNL